MTFGKNAIQALLEQFMSLYAIIEIKGTQFVSDTDTNICCSLWGLKNAKAANGVEKFIEISVEVLRKQKDGS